MSTHRFPASGCWLHFFSPLIAELAGQAGYDYTMIDMEHSPATLDSMLPVLQASQLGGARALVRVPERDPRWLGRVMDAGADGAMVPMVNTAEQAQDLASACLYPPQGSRGVATPVVRAARYGAAVSDYLRDYREAFLLIVQIETAEAVTNAADIAAIDGIDAVFIGPFDLSASLGHPGQSDHPEVRAAIAKVAAATKSAGKVLAGLPTADRDVARLAADGFELVIGGSDMTLLREAFYSDAARHRAALQR